MSTTATTAVEPPVLEPGAQLAPGLQVVELLSRGEALDVYEAFSADLLCSVIAKTVRPDRADVERVRDRLLLEGELLQRFAHPHLPRSFATITGRVPVVVLETIAGPTLEEIIDSRPRRLPATDLAHLGRQLCSATHYLHRQGYLHLDIRPANVVARDGVAVLIDLSIARPPGPVRRGLGSREYLAPEQALGLLVSAATDVWGIGATLFEAATGAAPFAPLDASEEELSAAGVYLQSVRPAPAPSRLGRRLPAGMVTLIADCLSPDPEQRPSVLAVHDRLGTFTAGLAI
ncbi:serine/threonine-protein kinase [Nocardioides sp. AX2bis]|uniref:serine/threonine-protein kinase n=1 Tax=Nocardioides sp. AX2bis TaxID=2653157 RepID=UPI0012EEE7ED|nr:serine/threonine-protein kinase [Nocardioides sp. AX2bis]VXB59986.1 Serine/threonine protein kinase [Nocardioides sp. AX2bis]